LRTVLDTIPIRIFWKGTNLKYLGCNQSFATDIGAQSPDEIIGKDDYQINKRELADLYRNDDHQVLEMGIPKFNYEEPMTMASGSFIWVRTSKVPLRSTDGAIHGVLGTYEDITESKRIEEERESLIGELESKNAELERFTYTVSHDLKSPLVTIKGFLGFLKQDVASGNMERFNSDLERIGNATKKMEQLLRDLLELSRIGRVLNPMETIPFEDLAQEALDIVHGQIEARGITVHIQPNLPTVFGDRQRLTEVLQNLLDNATKYMSDQNEPCVEVGLRGVESNKFIFFVRDNGIGIAPEHHERIFGLFNKLDVRSEGTGVGLALVKRIIENHGGRIWVESEPGKGAAFFFTLPGGMKEREEIA
jgi:PAS domain S-box-containing protein